MNDARKLDFSSVKKVIEQNRTFSIYSHMHTDIDAIGSSLALKMMLEKMGKKACVFIDSSFPDNSQTLKGVELINNQKFESYDVCVILDCPEPARLGRLQYKYRKNTKTSIQIDHHLKNTMFAKHNIVCEESSSTCELIYYLLKALRNEIDKEMCRCLLSGILTDTGGFKFSSTKGSTFVACAELMDKGYFVFDEITYALFNNLSLGAFELKKLSLNNLELFCDNKAGLIMLSADQIKNCGANYEDTKGLTDIPMQIKSVVCVVVASESPVDGIYYLSIRTKEKFSARNIAIEFGGGGHEKASGCKIPLEPSKVRELIKSAVTKEINKK